MSPQPVPAYTIVAPPRGGGAGSLFLGLIAVVGLAAVVYLARPATVSTTLVAPTSRPAPTQDVVGAIREVGRLSAGNAQAAVDRAMATRDAGAAQAAGKAARQAPTAQAAVENAVYRRLADALTPVATVDPYRSCGVAVYGATCHRAPTPEPTSTPYPLCSTPAVYSTDDLCIKALVAPTSAPLPKTPR